tara:strand:- start:564 stop:812 length:249 start_codon:yes stop_codon:yes gene_type:complete
MQKDSFEKDPKKAFLNFLHGCGITQVAVILAGADEVIIFYPKQVQVFGYGFKLYQGGTVSDIISFDIIKEICTISIVPTIDC